MAHPIKPLDAEGHLVPGLRLGHYEIEAPLGTGGMARVYRARDTRLGRAVAIKILEPPAADGARLRFDREARVASAVSHPHVLTVFDVGEWEGRPYVVSELLEGRTLRALLRPGSVGLRQAVEYAIQVCRGLGALHARGIVHRDLKPENVFVTTEGWVKILDLGLATAARDDAGRDGQDFVTTEGGAAFGTAGYMSPEQVRRLPADPRSDIFACGVILYEMLARRRPFQEETAAETMTAVLRNEPPSLGGADPAIPAALVRVVERCLAKQPEERFHSAHDLALALEASLGEPAPPRRSHPAPLRSHAPARLLPIATVVLTFATLAFWLNIGHKPMGLFGGPVALSRYDATGRRFAPFLEGIAAQHMDTSRDGAWVTYTSYPEGELWRARADGTERRRLSEQPLEAALPRFSPDATRIAFAGRAPGHSWQIYLVSRDGGPVDVLPPENVTDPGWTADGSALVFGPVSGTPGAILRYDLASGRQTLVPGSLGLFSPRPSPDGRYLAALTDGDYQLRLLDLGSGRWSKLGTGVMYPAWTRDGSWLHFRREENGLTSFSRLDPENQREEPVAEVGRLELSYGAFGAWSGLSPDGAPLVLMARAAPSF
jgi:hypothetical protein